MAEDKTVYQFAVTHAAGVGAVGVVEGSFYIEVDGNTANIGVCGAGGLGAGGALSLEVGVNIYPNMSADKLEGWSAVATGGIGPFSGSVLWNIDDQKQHELVGGGGAIGLGASYYYAVTQSKCTSLGSLTTPGFDFSDPPQVGFGEFGSIVDSFDMPSTQSGPTAGNLVLGGYGLTPFFVSPSTIEQNTYVPGIAPRCFDGDTPVLMADGGHKKIADVKVGDLVMAFEGLGALEPCVVERVMIADDRIVQEYEGDRGRRFRVTDGHPFLRPDGTFAPIGSAAEVMAVGAEGESVRLHRVDGGLRRARVYNLTVNICHTYVAAGMRVHNQKPVVIDLNGDSRVELVGFEESGVFFDMDEDGLVQNTAWVAPEDGLLSFDREGDGRVTHVREFAFSLYSTREDATDLEGLREAFDSNDDGVLDASDADFAKFGVWRDADQNGVCDDGEFQTLAQRGITSIGLVSDQNRYSEGGNLVFGSSAVQWADGTVTQAADVDLFAATAQMVVIEDHAQYAVLTGDGSARIAQLKDLSVVNFADASFIDSEAVIGTGGSDIIFTSGAENVEILGGAGEDMLVGGSGNDILRGGLGLDIMSGGGGNDVVFADAEDNLTVIQGGEGVDTFRFTSSAGVTLDLGKSSFELAYGNQGDDYFFTSKASAMVADGLGGDDRIVGSAKDDLLRGGDGRDTLFGGDGNDMLSIDAEDLQSDIHGGAGSDTVVIEGTIGRSFDLGLAEAETVFGGAGNDVITVGIAAKGAVNGGQGDDTVLGGAGADELGGGDGDDRVEGGGGDDVLAGDAGNDLVLGGAGDDAMEGGTGNDILDGGDGDDLIRGGAGIDTLIGGLGADVLYAAEGDILQGGAGRDTVVWEGQGGATIDLGAASIEVAQGGDGNDRFVSSSGAISVAAGLGADVVVGSENADVIDGGAGADTLSGGGGDDALWIDAEDRQADIDGGSGTDTVFTSDERGVSLDLGAAHIEVAIGHTGADIFSSSSGASIIADGGAGADTLLGGSGADTLIGGLGVDVLRGGAGDDVLGVDGQDRQTGLDGGEGHDTLFVTDGAVSLDLGAAHIEVGVGGNGNDLFWTSSAAIEARGGAGSDILRGGAGSDTLIGGSGSDTLAGGAGDDVLVVDADDAQAAIDGGLGTDQVVVDDSRGVTLDLGVAKVELAFGDVGRDVFGTSGTGAVYMDGGGGDDLLTGGSGNDTVFGGAGSDTLAGGAGNDTLTGGSGADVLSGGDGDDVLEVDSSDASVDGGAGYDTILAGNSGVSLDMAAVRAERFVGGDAGDVVVTSGPASIVAEGRGGRDTLTGGAGKDTLSGGNGADVLSGGAGDDTLLVDADDNAADIRGGDGIDRIIVEGARGASFDIGAMSVEIAVGGDGADVIIASVGGAVTIFGGAGADTLSGAQGDDVIDGGDGDDLVVVTGGNDTIAGGNGSDVAEFDGKVADFSLKVTHISQGGQTLLAGLVTDLRTGEVVTTSNVERLRFSDRTLDLTGTGNAPVAIDDRMRAYRDTAITFGAGVLKLNDWDLEKETFWVKSVGNVIGGTVEFDCARQTFTFVPEAGFVGLASFDYILTEASGATSPAATVTIEVDPYKPHDLPTDPLFGMQWNVMNTGQTGGRPGTDLNLTSVWADYTGQGVLIANLEGQVDYLQPDLVANYDTTRDWDFVENDADSLIRLPSAAGHSTSTTGFMVADQNNYGIVGIAHDARAFIPAIGADGKSSFSLYDEAIEYAWTHQADVANFIGIYLAASGLPSSFDVRAVEEALADATTYGRNGLGMSVAITGGNEYYLGYSTSYWTPTSSRYVASVAALNSDGTAASWSTPGPGILVAAPGVAMIADDVTGGNGYSKDDFYIFSGTCGATPLVTGVMALMIDANPWLGYRDVYEILAYSSRQTGVDPLEWGWNHAGNWNGGGLHVSDRVGYGLVDAHAAVRLAETWTATSVAANEVCLEGTSSPGQSIADLGSIVDTITLAPGVDIDRIEVDLNISHDWIGDLVVTLISPDGTESVLVNRPGKDPSSPNATGAGSDSFVYTVGSTHHYGESSGGIWTLKVEDAHADHTGSLNSWTLRVYGDEATVDDTYIYTDEYIWMGGEADAERRQLHDSNGGSDTINASAVSYDSVIDLTGATIGTLATQEFSIATGTVIENVYTGDGDDEVIGNDVDNRLWGGRGNDRLDGGAGDDSLFGQQGRDVLTGGGGNDSLSGGDDNDVLNGGVGNDNLAGDAGNDLLDGGSGDDWLDGGSDDDVLQGREGVDTLLGGSGADTLFGGAGADSLSGGDGDDILIGGAGADMLDGGAGIDTVSYRESAAGVVIDLGLGRGRGGDAEGDVLVGVEHVIGSNFDDYLVGGAGDETLQGGAGSDILDGGADFDTAVFEGLAGNYQIVLTGVSFSIVDNSNGEVDSLHDIERLVFADTVVDLIDGLVVVGDSYVMDEEGELALSLSALLSNDYDLTGQAVSFGGLGSTFHGQYRLDGDVVTFMPDVDFVGVAGFSYSITNPLGGQASGWVWVDVKNINDAPAAHDDHIGTTAEDTPLRIAPASLLGNDTDIDGDSLTVLSVSGAVGGSVMLTEDGSILFTPDQDFTGTAYFDYSIGDGHGATATARADIQVTPVNDAPVACLDTFEAVEDRELFFQYSELLGNDYDVDGDTIRLIGTREVYKWIDKVEGGTVQIYTNGVGFMPDPDFNGTTSFSYIIADSAGVQSIGHAVVHVAAVNDAPLVRGEALVAAANTPVVLSTEWLLANDSDKEGDAIRVSAIGNAVGGKVSWTQDGGIVFTPVPGYSGVARFDYLVADSGGATSLASVVLTITNALVGTEDSPLTIAADSLAGPGATFVSVSDAAGGSVDLVDGRAVFVPLADFNGSGQFSYSVMDATGAIVSSRAWVGITAVNDAPTAQDFHVSIQEDDMLTVSVSALLANVQDIDNDILSVVQVGDAVGGAVSLDTSTNSVVFRSAANFNGAASFSYTISDGHGGVVTRTAFVDVAPVNDAPVVQTKVFSIDEDTLLTLSTASLLADAVDADGDHLTVTAVNSVSGGNVHLDATGTVVFTPTANFHGLGLFTCTVSDAHGGQANQLIFVSVSSVNDAPEAVDVTLSGMEDKPLSIALSSLLQNATDADGDTLYVSAVSNVEGGVLTLGGAGELIFTPNKDFSGAAGFDFTIVDGYGGTVTKRATVDVAPVNDAPVVWSTPFVTKEDVPLVLDPSSLLAGATDADGDVLTVTSVEGGVGGSVSFDETGAVVFTPAANFYGIGSFRYTVSDGCGGNTTQTTIVIVSSVNDAPVVADAAFATDEDTPLTITLSSLLQGAFDVDGDVLYVSAVSNVQGGVLTLGESGQLIFTPFKDFNGNARFDFTVSDGRGGLTTKVATVAVASINDAPVLKAKSFFTYEDVPLVLDAATLLAGAVDADHDVLSVALVGSGVGGSVELDDSGGVIFRPNANFYGTASFSYTVTDGHGGSATQTAYISIASVNDAPVLADLAFATNEDTPLTISLSSLLQGASDADGDILYVSALKNVRGGLLVSAVSGEFTFVPTKNFNGNASFDYTISDGRGGNTTKTATVAVAVVNDLPTVKEISFSTPEDTPLALDAATLLANAIDVDGDPLSLAWVGNAVGGSVEMDADGGISFTPTDDFHGMASFEYRVSDGQGGERTDTATVTVSTENDPPIVQDQFFTTQEDIPLSLSPDLLLQGAEDPDGDVLRLWSVGNAISGNVSLDAAGNVVFVPDANFCGIASFDFVVTDDQGALVTRTATIDVSAVNDAPELGGVNVATEEDVPLTLAASAILSVASDVEGGALTLVWVGNGQGGVVVLGGDGNPVFTPSSNFNGVASFEYQISDPDGVVSTGMVSVRVAAVNDAPLVNDRTVSISEDEPLIMSSSSILGGALDVDDDVLRVLSVDHAVSGSVSIDEQGRVVFVPTANYNGSASFDYVVTDDRGGVVTRSVQIDVAPVNDAPVTVSFNTSTEEDVPLTLAASSLLSLARDVEGDALSLSWVGNGQGGSVVLDEDGHPVFTPAVNFNGSASFQYSVADGHGGVSTNTVLVQVMPVNDAPQAQDVALGVGVGQGITFSGAVLLADATDVDGDSLVLTQVGNAVGGSVYLDASGDVVFTPANDAVEAAQFDYTVADGKGGSVTRRVVIAGFDAEDATVATQREKKLEGILPVAAGAGCPALAYNLSTGPAHGTVTIAADGRYVYVPEAGFTGTDSFVYQAIGFGGSIDEGRVSVQVGARLLPGTSDALRANTYNSGEQYQHHVVSLADGGFVVIWTSQAQDGSRKGISAQRYDVFRQPVGGEFRVNTWTAQDQLYPVATSLSDGGFVVAWMSYGQDSSGYGIFAQRYDANCQPVGDEFQVNTYTRNRQENPVITGLNDGGFVVVWQSLSQAAPDSGMDVFGQCYDAAGRLKGGEFRINSYIIGDQGNSGTVSRSQMGYQVAPLDGGGFVVVWQSSGQDGSGQGVYAQRYDAAGQAVGAEFQVNTYTTLDQDSLKIASLVGGGFVVIWSSNGQDTSLYGIYGQCYDATGQMIGNEFQANTYNSNDQSYPVVAALADGGFVVAWQSYGQENYSYGVNESGIYAQRYNSFGRKVSGEFHVNTYTSGNQYAPFIVALADGGFVVVWTSYLQDGSQEGVYGQRYNVMGQRVQTEFRININTSGGQFRPMVTASADGGFLVTWLDGTTSGQGVFVRAYGDGGWQGGTGDDLILGGDAAEIIRGEDGSDALRGGGGDDTLIGGAGDDTLEGGNGNDTALFTGRFQDYAVTRTALGAATIVGGEGTDVTIGVEWLKFSDRSINIGANVAPSLGADYLTGSEDQIVQVSVAQLMANDLDADGDAMTLLSVGGAVGGSVVLGEDGIVTFTAKANFAGIASFIYTVADIIGAEKTATVHINVAGVNDLPVTVSESVDVSAGDCAVLALSAADVETIHLQRVIVNGPEKGVLSLQPDGTYLYDTQGAFDDLAIGESRVVSIDWKVVDSNGIESFATATVTVNGVNDAPVAVDGVVALSESSGATTIVLSATDVDQATALAYQVVDKPQFGRLVDNGDGTVTYDPAGAFESLAEGETQTVSFTWKALDDFGADSGLRTTTITVTGANDGPVAVADAFSTEVSAVLAVDAGGGLLANDSDVDGDDLSIMAGTIATAKGGVVALNSDGSFIYTPKTGFSGQDSFAYTVVDGHGGTASASVTLTVNPGAHSPVAAADSYSTREDMGFSVRAQVGVLANDLDPDGDPLAVTDWDRVTAHGGVVEMLADGSFSYRPAANFHGVDTFEYDVDDGHGGLARGTVSISVQSVNDAPVALADNYSTTARQNLAVLADAGLMANDSDVDGGVLTVASYDSRSAQGGWLTVMPDGSFVYTPPSGFTGEDRFSYVLADGQGGFVSQSASIQVAGDGSGPLAEDDSYVVDEDGILSVAGGDGVLSNDSSAVSGALTVLAATVTSEQGGKVVLRADGGFDYTPLADFNGEDGFTYTVRDQAGNTSTGRVGIVVNPVAERNDASNQVLVVYPDFHTVNEDNVLSVSAQNGVIGADNQDADGNVVTVQSYDAVGTAGGIIVMNDDGSFTYTPPANFSGADTFAYTITNGQGATAVSMVTVTVASVSDAPVAVDDTVSGYEDQPLMIAASQLLANDTDIEGDALSVESVSHAQKGTVRLDGSGNIVFTPDADFSGQASFEYRVRDASGALATASVHVDVAAVNDAPILGADTLAGVEDTGLLIHAADLLGNDSDPEGDALEILSVAAGIGGMAELNGDGDVLFTPDADFVGEASFTYTVRDAFGALASQTVLVQVAGTNDAPVSAADQLSGVEDKALILRPAQLLANDFDVDGDVLTVSSVGNAIGGTVALDVNGNVVFTPEADFYGTVSFDYVANDGHGGLTTGMATITFAAVNDSPVAAADSLTVAEDLTLTLQASTLLGNDTDVDGDALSIYQVGGATHGSVTKNADGNVVFTPVANFNGVASFQYAVSDGHGGYAVATVQVLVTPVNDAPVATIDAFTIQEDQVLLLSANNLLVNDSDVDGDTLSVSAVGTAVHGTVVLDAVGQITFTPDADFNGIASFEYTVSDGQGGTSTKIVYVKVEAVGDAPVANPDTFAGAEDAELVISAAQLLSNDYDVDGDTLSIVSVGQGIHCTVSKNADGDVVFVPEANFHGVASFQIQVGDGSGHAVVSTVTVDLASVNDAPVVSNALSYASHEDASAIAVDLLEGASDDADGDVLSVTDLLQTQGRTVAFTQDGSVITIDPGQFTDLAVGETETLVFTYEVDDGVATTSQQLTLVIEGRNDAPVFSSTLSANANDDQDSIALDLLADVLDVDANDILSVVEVQQTGGRPAVFQLVGGILSLAPRQFADLVEGETETLTFTLRVTDEHVEAVQALTIAVEGTNNRPVLQAALSVEATEDAAPLELDLLQGASDPDGGTVLSVVDVAQVDGESAVFTLDGHHIRIDPAQFDGLAKNEVRQLVFTYNVSDGVNSTPQTLTVSIVGTNDAPVLATEHYTVDYNGHFGLSAASGVLANDSDANGDTLRVISYDAVTAAGGSVFIGSDGRLTYVAKPFYEGADSFRYTVSDGHGGVETMTAAVTVLPAPATAPTDLSTYGTAVTDIMSIFAPSSFASLVQALPEAIKDPNRTLTGGSGRDVLLGSSGNDVLIGNTGDDILMGGAGSDRISGGEGHDTYLFAFGSGIDVVDAFDSTIGKDRVLFTSNVDADNIWFTRNGQSLDVAFIGHTDRLTISGWYDSVDRQTDFQTMSGWSLRAAQVEQMVVAMAAFAPAGVASIQIMQSSVPEVTNLAAQLWAETSLGQ